LRSRKTVATGKSPEIIKSAAQRAVNPDAAFQMSRSARGNSENCVATLRSLRLRISLLSVTPVNVQVQYMWRHLDKDRSQGADDFRECVRLSCM
jgi:hypothetical protein